jgi:hypothetical protein
VGTATRELGRGMRGQCLNIDALVDNGGLLPEKAVRSVTYNEQPHGSIRVLSAIYRHLAS